MKKEYLQQFIELNEKELSELINDLTEIWHIKHFWPSAEEMESNEVDEEIEYKIEEDLELERDNNFIRDNNF